MQSDIEISESHLAKWSKLYDRLCVILTIVKNEVRSEVPLPIVDLLACFAEAVGVNICKVCAPRAKPAQKKNRRQQNRQNIK